MAGHFDKARTAELKVLDLGCGQGSSSWFLAKEGFQVTAVDGSQSAIRKTGELLERDGLTFAPIQACMTSLPVSDNEFDFVVDVIASVHNSMEDVHKIFAEIARVLKPGGLLFSVMPTNNCSRRAFRGFGAIQFLKRQDIDWLLKYHFTHVDVMISTYQIDHETTIKNWIVSAERKT